MRYVSTFLILQFIYNICICVCVFSNVNPLHYYALRGFAQGGQMALSAVYFRFTYRLGKPHYVWDEYLYGVLKEVEVGVTVCGGVCVVECEMMMKGKEKVKPDAGS